MSGVCLDDTLQCRGVYFFGIESRNIYSGTLTHQMNFRRKRS